MGKNAYEAWSEAMDRWHELTERLLKDAESIREGTPLEAAVKVAKIREFLEECEDTPYPEPHMIEDTARLAFIIRISEALPQFVDPNLSDLARDIVELHSVDYAKYYS